jgi:hypothetical protein
MAEFIFEAFVASGRGREAPTNNLTLEHLRLGLQSTRLTKPRELPKPRIAHLLGSD